MSDTGSVLSTAQGKRTGVSTGELLSTLGVALTVTAALLFYFGWTRNQVLSTQLGYSETLLAHRPEDYILRSVASIYRLALGAAVTILLGVTTTAALLGISRKPIGRSMVLLLVWFFRAIAIAVTVALALGLLFESLHLRVSPDIILIAGGLLVVGESAAQRIQRDANQDGAPIFWIPAGGLRLAMHTGIILLLIVGAFAKTTQIAAAEGRRLAADLASNPANQASAVVVYATYNLSIAGPGVTVGNELSGSRYRFRYDGLLMYQYSRGRYFFIPNGWRGRPNEQMHLPLVIISDTADVRVEVVASS